MDISSQAQKIHAQVNTEGTTMGDLRKIAKDIKKDHDLALALWSTGGFMSRQLAILIMDKKLLSQEVIQQLVEDMETHEYEQRMHLADWLMANQLTKDKKLIGLIESWEHHTLAILRRIFWYYQARLRWTGQTPPDNTTELLTSIEARMLKEVPEVQWAMNFTAGWIGVFDETRRNQCVQLGESLGLYKDEVVARGCTPSYLPAFITTEVDKRKK